MGLREAMRWLRVRWVRWWALGCVAAVLRCGGARYASRRRGATRAKKAACALSPWEQAEQGRDALEAMPEGDRTRAEYTRAMDAYRAIYHANPADAACGGGGECGGGAAGGAGADAARCEESAGGGGAV